MAEHASFTTVLANRRFLILWSNQILLQLSMNTLNFSLLVWVFHLTGSNAAVSLFVLSVMIPALIFGALAGVVADVMDRRRIIIITDCGMALSIIGFLIIKEQLGLILLVSLVFNSFVQFFVPTEAAAIPMVVKKNELFVANSLFFFTMYGAILIGYSLAGPLVNFWGQDGIFILATLACLGAFLIARLLPSLKAGKEEFEFDIDEQSGWSGAIKKTVEVTFTRISSGFGFVFANVRVWMAIVLLACLQGVIAMVATLTPGFFEKVMRVSATDSYILMVPLGLGLLTGALIVGRWGSRWPRRTMVGNGVFLAGVFILVTALLPSVISFFNSQQILASTPRSFTAVLPTTLLLTLFAFGLGVATVHIAIPAQTTLQENAHSAIRGRTFSILSILTAIASAIPAVVAGGAADVFGIVPVMVSVGLFIVILSVGVRCLYYINRSYLPNQIDNLLYGRYTNRD